MSEEQQPVEASKPNVNDILASLSELNKKQIIKIYVPSMQEDISFRPLTVKQQKNLLSSGVDVEIENLTFSNTINSIITENCLSNKDQIRLTDRSMIVYQLRCNSVGETLSFIDDDVTYTVNLREHIDNIKQNDLNPPTKFKVSVEDLVVEGEVPGLDRDTKYNKQFTKTMKGNKTVDGIKLTDIVGDIYIHEMMKYVTTIQAQDQILNLDDVKISQAISIFESLPMTVSSQVAKEIKNCRELELMAMSADQLPEDVQLPFDASMFTGE